MTVLIFALCCVLGTAIYFKVVRPLGVHHVQVHHHVL